MGNGCSQFWAESHLSAAPWPPESQNGNIPNCLSGAAGTAPLPSSGPVVPVAWIQERGNSAAFGGIETLLSLPLTAGSNLAAGKTYPGRPTCAAYLSTPFCWLGFALRLLFRTGAPQLFPHTRLVFLGTTTLEVGLLNRPPFKSAPTCPPARTCVCVEGKFKPPASPAGHPWPRGGPLNWTSQRSLSGLRLTFPSLARGSGEHQRLDLASPVSSSPGGTLPWAPVLIPQPSNHGGGWSPRKETSRGKASCGLHCSTSALSRCSRVAPHSLSPKAAGSFGGGARGCSRWALRHEGRELKQRAGPQVASVAAAGNAGGREPDERRGHPNRCPSHARRETTKEGQTSCTLGHSLRSLASSLSPPCQRSV